MKEESLSKKFTDFDESSTLWSGEREEKESQMGAFSLNYRRVDRVSIYAIWVEKEEKIPGFWKKEETFSISFA